MIPMTLRNFACQMCPDGKRRIGKQRGLCSGCYHKARTAVKAGKLTWRDLHAKGLCTLTPEECGHKRNVLFDTRRIRFGAAAPGFPAEGKVPS